MLATHSGARGARRLAVVALFRRCLRSARLCPSFEQRAIMAAYVRGRFRDANGAGDPVRLVRLLADGEAELRTMDSFHAVRLDKERAERGETAPALAPTPAARPAPTPVPNALQATLPVPRLEGAPGSGSDAVLQLLVERIGLGLVGIGDERAPLVQRLALSTDAVGGALAGRHSQLALAAARTAHQDLQLLVFAMRKAGVSADLEPRLAALSLDLKRLLARLLRESSKGVGETH